MKNAVVVRFFEQNPDFVPCGLASEFPLPGPEALDERAVDWAALCEREMFRAAVEMLFDVRPS